MTQEVKEKEEEPDYELLALKDSLRAAPLSELSVKRNLLEKLFAHVDELETLKKATKKEKK